MLESDDGRIARAVRLAQLSAALERTVQFETTGSLNGHDVQRAWLELRGETLGLYVLRDRANMIRLAVYGPEGTLSRRRPGADAPWRDTVSDDIAWITSHLRRSNFLPSWIDSPEQDDVDAADIRAAFAVPSPSAGRRPLPGEHALEGLRASPGRAVGPARLGLEGRHPEHLDGGILVVPSLRPADCPFLFNVAGVLCTGGSILSHAGLLAVEFGRPALDRPRALGTPGRRTHPFRLRPRGVRRAWSAATAASSSASCARSASTTRCWPRATCWRSTPTRARCACSGRTRPRSRCTRACSTWRSRTSGCRARPRTARRWSSGAAACVRCTSSNVCSCASPTRCWCTTQCASCCWERARRR